jgi:flagellar biosynthesis/type III secretory pathway protein FliH
MPVRGSTAVGATPSSWDWEELDGLPAPMRHHPVDQAELDALREQELEAAYRRGRADGEQAAHTRARREVETAVAAARGALQQVRDGHESWSQHLEENLVALATAISRQILERELKGDLETFRVLVRKASATFPLDQAVRIRLHPSDLAVLARANGGQVPAEADTDNREARWIADEDVVPGGCIVEGPDRIVDGRVDAALERVYRELTHG